MDQDSEDVARSFDGRPLAGRTAVVTRGSRGIGRAIVRRLAADGALVVFSYGSSDAAAKEVVAEVADAGGQALAVRAELTDLDQVEELFLAADQYFHDIGAAGLDILVNNAGTFVRTPIGSTTEADYDRQMDVNA